MHKKIFWYIVFAFSLVYLFSYSCCIHYHPPSFSCILTCYYYSLLTKKMTMFCLSLTHTSTFARRESLSALHDVVVNVFFLSLHCCCSAYVDSYLFLSYKRRRERYAYNKAAHGADKLFNATYASVCMFLFFLHRHTFLLFFLHIINFPFL